MIASGGAGSLDDLVAGLERPPECARQHEVERRHRRPEDRLAGRAAEERGRDRVRLVDERGELLGRVVPPPQLFLVAGRAAGRLRRLPAVHAVHNEGT